MISQHRNQSKARAVCGLAIAVIIASVTFTEAQSQPPEAEPAVTTSTDELSGDTGQQLYPSHYSGTYTNKTITTMANVLSSGTAAIASTMHTPLLMTGKKPFKLTVDENVGELIYTFNESTKALETIEGKKGVVFSREGTTISCDNLIYNSSKQELVATGPMLLAELGTMKVTADTLVYKPDEGEWQFSGNAEVTQQDKFGKVTKTNGTGITIITHATGKYQMVIKTGNGTETYVRPDS